jgi:hypothetical protein
MIQNAKEKEKKDVVGLSGGGRGEEEKKKQ